MWERLKPSTAIKHQLRIYIYINHKENSERARKGRNKNDLVEPEMFPSRVGHEIACPTVGNLVCNHRYEGPKG